MLVVDVDYEPQSILCMEIRGGEENTSCLGIAVAFDKSGGMRCQLSDLYKTKNVASFKYLPSSLSPFSSPSLSPSDSQLKIKRAWPLLSNLAQTCWPTRWPFSAS